MKRYIAVEDIKKPQAKEVTDVEIAESVIDRFYKRLLDLLDEENRYGYLSIADVQNVYLEFMPHTKED